MTLLRPRLAAALLALASAAILAGAYAFQFYGGLAPCILCLVQRKPHMLAIGFAVLATLLAGRRLPWTMLMAAAVCALWIGAAVAVFHVGVEQHWWQGTAACGAPDAGTAGNADDLLAELMAAPVIRCDQAAWTMWGVSMAGYNALLSLALGTFGVAALVRDAQPRPQRRRLVPAVGSLA